MELTDFLHHGWLWSNVLQSRSLVHLAGTFGQIGHRFSILMECSVHLVPNRFREITSDQTHGRREAVASLDATPPIAGLNIRLHFGYIRLPDLSGVQGLHGQKMTSSAIGASCEK